MPCRRMRLLCFLKSLILNLLPDAALSVVISWRQTGSLRRNLVSSNCHCPSSSIVQRTTYTLWHMVLAPFLYLSVAKDLQVLGCASVTLVEMVALYGSSPSSWPLVVPGHILACSNHCTGPLSLTLWASLHPQLMNHYYQYVWQVACLSNPLILYLLTVLLLKVLQASFYLSSGMFCSLLSVSRDFLY